MGWKNVLRSYFTFNKLERRGIWILLFILISLFTVHLYLRLSPVSHPEISADEFEDFMKAAAASEEIPITGERDEIGEKPGFVKDYSGITWHPFNPNKASSETFIELGLDERIAGRIEKYRSKGGLFRSPEDLFKIYGIDSMWVEAALPYMIIPQETILASHSPGPENDTPARDVDKEARKPAPKSMVDLNRADTTALLGIKGIGSYYANEIINLREKLGGFRSHEQLLGLYRMRDETMDILARHSFIDTTAITKIDLNTCSVEALGKHPYISWKQAKIVVNYRLQHGKFRSVRDILETDAIPDSVYLKIAPYLKVE